MFLLMYERTEDQKIYSRVTYVNERMMHKTKAKCVDGNEGKTNKNAAFFRAQ